MQRVLGVDEQRRVLGVVSDEELLDRVTPALRAGALHSLMRKLPFSVRHDPADQHASATSAAGLMTEALMLREDQLLRDAIAPMIKAPHRIVGWWTGTASWSEQWTAKTSCGGSCRVDPAS